MRTRTKLLIAYSVLLAASHLARGFQSDTGPGTEHQRIVTLREIRRGAETGKDITLAYRDYPVPGREDAPALVLLHGSPGNSNQLNGLIEQFREKARLLVPDLPGFGGSTRKIADYSVEAHARYLAQWLDGLGLEEAHLLGFSMGGGVAIAHGALAPERTASLILVGSIGVQELELLGDFTLNHAVHSVQLAGLWLLQEGLPHFGLLDNTMLNVSYARNFYDTDQRPLRGHLASFDAPALIVHGQTDFLVPISAAKEHHRLLPQSEIVVLEDGHFSVFTNPETLQRPVLDFLRRVERRDAVTRETATPERLANSEKVFDWETHGRPRPIAILPMSILLALSTLASEDLTCIGAGILASRGVIPFAAAAAACFVGIFFGDFALYLAGRAFGRGALRRRPFRWLLTENDVERSAHFFHRYGPSLILTTRFIPGARLPTYFSAGILGTGFWRFSGWFLLAAALWTPLLVGAAFLLGGRLLTWFEGYERFTLLALLIVVGLLLLLPKAVLPLFNQSGRRLLLSRWRRATRWEFWPMWAIYPPVLVYILWLGFRHRKPTLFTAVNPSIPAGGLALESKSEILRGFGDTESEIARFVLIPEQSSPSEKIAGVEDFMRTRNLAFPIVLKPDVGERGQGVLIARDRNQCENYLQRCPHDVIAQEYVSGEEFGVFYYRYPEEETGKIFSITDKRLIGVRGDGRRTLEELILEDERAVCMAPFFLNQFAAQLDSVPAHSEEVPLTELGTHCRGALFLDGWEVWTPDLERAIDALSKRFEGFYFGRYDLRVSSREELQRGMGFKVLELNGVTSEATHIYAPGTSLRRAHATLRKQWQIAFDIAHQNVIKGAKPYSIRETWRLFQQFRRTEKFET